MRHRAALVLLVPVVLPAVAGCASVATDGAVVEVRAGEGTCEVSRTAVDAGPVTFRVSNGSQRSAELYVYGADGTTVQGEVEDVGPGTSRDLVVELAAGSAVVACRPDDATEPVRTTIAVGDAQAAAPADPRLDQAVAEYRAYVATESAALLAATEEFVTVLRAGDVGAAKAAYPRARVHWERIEPVAESFAELDAAIDARQDAVAPGTSWTGWHRLEKALWVDGSTAGTDALAAGLLADTRTLVDRIPSLEITPSLLGNGAAALLEEVATGKVTGEEERYSRTDLWDFDANVDGARAAFDALAPVLADADPALHDRLVDRFDALARALAAHRDGEGFVPYDALTAAQVRDLADKVDALAEPLSTVTAAVLAR